jgi:hypothetical protein
MSLSAWEQDALDTIGDGLADSDPALAARLAMFSRLASGEAMPAREKLQAASRRVVQRGAGRSRRLYRRLGVQRTMLLVWLVTTLTLIAAAVASSRGDGPRTCTGSWVTLCSGVSAAAPPAHALTRQLPDRDEP